ncbi:hypothetical protein [Mammaliicoccus vitulinus]|uniref:hypothetical protein n=1 Tax=Mammaliicoccus vitulinus TaxID=71237 RepID=UPI00248D13B7|nr:hypothetical protein [Mammaliicoccus vitulinus]
MEDSFATGYAVGRDGTNGSGMGYGWGEWIWIIVIFAILGWGGNGFGNGFGGGNGGQAMGYELGKLATQSDIAAGFNNSAVLSKLNEITLSNETGFAGVQQTLCQGFGGVNNAITVNGYETRLGISDLGYRLQDCCCTTQRQIERSTCDIIQANNANTQRIVDYLTGEKISALQTENSLLTAQLSQNSQTATLLNAINRVPTPAYVVPNPYASYGYGYGYGYPFANSGCQCASIQ